MYNQFKLLLQVVQWVSKHTVCTGCIKWVFTENIASSLWVLHNTASDYTNWNHTGNTFWLHISNWNCTNYASALKDVLVPIRTLCSRHAQDLLPTCIESSNKLQLLRHGPYTVATLDKGCKFQHFLTVEKFTTYSNVVLLNKMKDVEKTKGISEV